MASSREQVAAQILSTTSPFDRPSEIQLTVFPTPGGFTRVPSAKELAALPPVSDDDGVLVELPTESKDEEEDDAYVEVPGLRRSASLPTFLIPIERKEDKHAVRDIPREAKVAPTLIQQHQPKKSLKRSHSAPTLTEDTDWTEINLEEQSAILKTLQDEEAKSCYLWAVAFLYSAMRATKQKTNAGIKLLNKALAFYPELSYQKRAVTTCFSIVDGYGAELGFSSLVYGIAKIMGGGGTLAVAIAANIVGASAALIAATLTQHTIGSHFRTHSMFKARMDALSSDHANLVKSVEHQRELHEVKAERLLADSQRLFKRADDQLKQSSMYTHMLDNVLRGLAELKEKDQKENAAKIVSGIFDELAKVTQNLTKLPSVDEITQLRSRFTPS